MQLAAGGLSNRRFNPNTTNDFQGLINGINALPNRASFYSLLDADGNGTYETTSLYGWIDL